MHVPIGQGGVGVGHPKNPNNRPHVLTTGKRLTQAEKFPQGSRTLTPSGADPERLRWLGLQLDLVSSLDGLGDELRKALLLEDAHAPEREDQLHFAFD